MQNPYPNYPPYPPYPPYQPNPYQVKTAPRQGLAIASMVIGICCLFTLSGLFIGAIIGIMLGAVALSRANGKPMVYGGKGYAIAGIVLCSISFLFSSMVAAIAIPNLLAARRSANAASAIHMMRELHSAEASYQAGYGNGNFASAEELFKQGFIDAKLANAAGVPAMSVAGQYCEGNGKPLGGYRFRITTTKATSGQLSTFKVEAMVSEDRGTKRTGDRNFFVNETGVIRASRNASETPDERSTPLNN